MMLLQDLCWKAQVSLSFSECSHFTWTPVKGGSCQLKSGEITKEEAVAKKGAGVRCGLATEQVTIEKSFGGIFWA